MVGMRTPFTGEEAPCGKIVNGEHYRDDDGDGLVIKDAYYSCGCRRVLHEYHDGSCHEQAIRHDKRRVRDEVGPDHGS